MHTTAISEVVTCLQRYKAKFGGNIHMGIFKNYFITLFSLFYFSYLKLELNFTVNNRFQRSTLKY